VGRKRLLELNLLRSGVKPPIGRLHQVCKLPAADSALIAACVDATKVVASELGIAANTLATFLTSPEKPRENGVVLVGLLAAGATSQNVHVLISDPSGLNEFRSLLEAVEDRYVIKLPAASRKLAKSLGVTSEPRWQSILNDAAARIGSSGTKRAEVRNVRAAIGTLPERILSLGMLPQFCPGNAFSAADVMHAIDRVFEGYGIDAKIGMPHVKVALEGLQRDGHIALASKSFQIKVLEVEEWRCVIEHRKLNELRAVDLIAKCPIDCRAVLNDLEEWRTHMVEASSANGTYSPIDFFESDIGFHSVLAASTDLDRSLNRHCCPTFVASGTTYGFIGRSFWMTTPRSPLRSDRCSIDLVRRAMKKRSKE
jgi:hypothetical protein